MRKSFKAALAVVICGVIAFPAAVGLAKTNTDDGKRVALSSCAYCHVVAPDQGFTPVLKPQGPDFATIAADPKNTAGSLRAFLFRSHRTDANTSGVLDNSELADVVDYIVSLRQKK